MTGTVAERLARGLRDAGAVVTFVPGFGATQVFEAYTALQEVPPVTSFHEEVSFTVAHGASLAGRRAVALLKTHGLAKAANSAMDAVTAGVTAGFVPIVFDDPTGQHSDSIADPVRLLEGLQMPYIRGGSGNVRAQLHACFATSEREQLPCALVLGAAEMSAPASPEASPAAFTPPRAAYRRRIEQHVLCPPFARYQHQVLVAKQHERDWQDLPAPEVPTLPGGVPPAWRKTVEAYLPFFDVFRRIRRGFVAGDTGLSSLFALPPFGCVDVTTYMGGSLPLALGAHLAGAGAAWAVTGDFAFLAAGHLGLLEAVQRRVPLKVVLLADGRASATGGQPVPFDPIERVLAGYRAHVRTLSDPTDPAEIEAVLTEADAATELRIVVARYA